MFGFRRVLAAVIVAGLLPVLVSCGGPEDPAQRAREQRARWNVTLLDWSQSPDGSVTLSARVSGPPNSDLDRLTVLVQLFDADENEIDRTWHTFDLSDVQRGGPADKIIRIRDLPGEVAGAGIDPVLDPTAEDEPHIPELNP